MALRAELERAAAPTPSPTPVSAGRSGVAAPPPPVVVSVRPSFTRSPVFVMLISIAVCFLLLMAIRPPFILTAGDRAGRAVGPSVLWSVVAGAFIIGIPAVVNQPSAT